MFASMQAIQSALGWAVMQFLWQGAVIGLGAAAALALVQRDNAAARCAVAGGALVISLITFGATFGLGVAASEAVSGPLVALPAAVDLDAPEFAAAATILAELTGSRPARVAEPAAPLAWLWAAGVLVMALRLALGCRVAHRLRTRSLTPVEPSLQRMLDALRLDLGIRRAVRLFTSELVESPAVVGWLTPLILVPATSFTALTPEQLRCVLAHELAHIRRYDHLANALQALIEVLLFFHPVVWWLSRVVRVEREHCCDSAAVHVTGSSLLLAQALTRLESLRLTQPGVALAAKTHGGPLMKRISRIVDSRAAAPQRPLGWRALSTLGAGILALGLGVAQAAPGVAGERTAAASAPTQSRDAKADYAIIEARILSAIEAGELSAHDAKTTLSALRRTMFPQRVRRAVTDAQLDPRAKYAAAEKKARAAVEAGKITGEEARDRLLEYRKQLGEKERAKQAKESKTITRQYYLMATKKIRAAVEADDLSREDARKKLEWLRRRIETDNWRKERVEKRDAEIDARLEADIRRIFGGSRPR